MKANNQYKSHLIFIIAFAFCYNNFILVKSKYIYLSMLLLIINIFPYLQRLTYLAVIVSNCHFKQITFEVICFTDCQFSIFAKRDKYCSGLVLSIAPAFSIKFKIPFIVLLYCSPNNSSTLPITTPASFNVL